MSKAFTKESDSDDDDLEAGPNPIPPGSKNYLTPLGHRRLLDELSWLMNDERPAVTRVVSWAAGNGDRSENGDYQYGKKRLREIDRRIRYLTKRVEAAEVIDPEFRNENSDQIFFSATVLYTDALNQDHTISIVGIDEVDLALGYISWISPLARALIKAREGDTVIFMAPSGKQILDILAVRYSLIPMAGFERVESDWKPNTK